MNNLKRYAIPAIGLAAVSCGGPGQQENQDQQHPNVIYILPDQFRNQALNFWNEPEYQQQVNWQADPVHTPNLDRFADESVVFANACSNFPLSSPYRGIFLSGMYPERSGIVLNCMEERPGSELRQDATCISDVFKAQGYSCGYIGKLHADFPTKNNPQRPGTYVDERHPVWDAYTPAERRHGFDYWYSYGTFDEHKNPHYWDKDGKRYDPKEYSVDHETDKAIAYLRNEHGERMDGQPFFMVLAYNPPHSPYRSMNDCMEEDYAYYKDMGLDELYVRENADTTMKKALAARYYFANVTGVDRNFGRLMKELEDLGLDDNTIVVFTADHGETMCSHGIDEPKNNIYTEAFTVPFMIRYPGKIRHRVEKTLFSAIDIMPTMLSLAGFSAEIPESCEGRDIAPMLLENGEKCDIPQSALYIKNVNGKRDEDGLVRSFFPVARGIRTAHYSMSIQIDPDCNIKDVKLFNDVDDPYQLYNIDYRQNPDLFDELCDLLRAKLEEANDVWFREGYMDRLKY